MEYRHKWECGAVVENVTREREVAGLNPTGHVACELCAKNATTSDGDGRTMTGGGLPQLKKVFAIFFEVFLSFEYCRVLTFCCGTKRAHGKRFAVCPKKGNDKGGFAGWHLPWVLCRVQHTAKAYTHGKSLCRVYYGLCCVPLAHGKLLQSGSDRTLDDRYCWEQCWWQPWSGYAWNQCRWQTWWDSIC